MLLPPCPLSGHLPIHWWGQDMLSSGRFLVPRMVGCCAAQEVRTRCLWERCFAHTFPNLTREGLMSAREESVHPRQAGSSGNECTYPSAASTQVPGRRF